MGKSLNLTFRPEKDYLLIKKMVFNPELKNVIFSKKTFMICFPNYKKYHIKAFSCFDQHQCFGIILLKNYKSLNMTVLDVGFLKKYRGIAANEISKRFLLAYFKRFPENHILVKVDKSNKAAIYFARHLGFERRFSTSTHLFFLRNKNGLSH